MRDKLDGHYLRRLLRIEQERVDLASHLLLAAGRYRQLAIGHPVIIPPKTPEERTSLNAKAAQASEFARRVLLTPIDHGDDA